MFGRKCLWLDEVRITYLTVEMYHLTVQFLPQKTLVSIQSLKSVVGVLAFYSENRMKHANKFCGHNSEFFKFHST
jgi:hypothetical protein